MFVSSECELNEDQKKWLISVANRKATQASLVGLGGDKEVKFVKEMEKEILESPLFSNDLGGIYRMASIFALEKFFACKWDILMEISKGAAVGH